MRRRSLVEPQDPRSSNLHPALQAVLENLDVRLEEELTRYRRLRARQPIASARRRATPGKTETGGRSAPAQPASVQPALTAGSPPLQFSSAPSQTGQSPPILAPFPTAGGSLSISAIAATAKSSQSAPLTLTPNDSFSITAAPSRPPAGPHSAPSRESSDQLLRGLAEEEAEQRQRQQDPSLLSSLLTPLGIGSMLLLLLSSVTFGYLLMNPASLGLIGLGNAGAPAETETLPQRGASGSEGNSLTENPSDSPSSDLVPSGPNLAEQEFRDLNLDTLSSVPSRSTVPATPARSAARSPSPPTPTASNSSPVPAAPSFDLAPSQPSVATIPLNPPRSSSPAIAPTAPAERPAAPRRSPTTTSRRSQETRAENPPAPRRAATNRDRNSNRANSASSTGSAAAPPSPRTQTRQERSSQRQERAARSQSAPARSTQAPRTQRTAPRSASNSTATRSAPSPATAARSAETARRYRVEVPYTGDQSLEQVRRAVPDAYLRNGPEGARIQLGVFNDRERATQLQQELQQQGISAEIDNP